MYIIHDVQVPTSRIDDERMTGIQRATVNSQPAAEEWLFFDIKIPLIRLQVVRDGEAQKVLT